ncbi:MAG: cytidylate kinase [Gallionellales bacterium GWA2_59_43]|nr:MAG: cytidylate kinase [Gallionellales bacterium GWA2_59_43]
MTSENFLNLPPLLSARGKVTLPGSKSISNRVLLLAALSKTGVTEKDEIGGVATVVHDLLHSDDTERMLDALRTLGVKVEPLGGNDYRVTGCGGNFPVKEATLFLGNAGTAFRPLTAALALAGGHYVLSGGTVESPGGRMHERPIRDLVDALREVGANIDYLGKEGFPPLKISPPNESGGDTVRIRGDVSSQFLSSLLMALPLLDRKVNVAVEGELISQPYITITQRIMESFGAPINERQGLYGYTIDKGMYYRSTGEAYVEGDASSASYFLAAGAIGAHEIDGVPACVRVEGVGQGSVQGDVRFADALALMGARIEMGPNWMESRAPVSGRLKAIDLDCNHIPDAAMTLAVAALFADGTTTLRNIASWRVKETDRIAAMATELRKVGATVEEGADFIRITPPTSRSSILNPAAGIDTYDDHRMAMCFSLAAFGGAGVRINDPKCVAKTFPDYFAAFASVTQAVPVIAIDGPSASGKGTVAGRVAATLGFHYLDSGALYRLLALAAQRDGIALDDETALAALAGRIDIRFEDSDIWLDGVKVGDELRSEETGGCASKVAALHQVRAALLDKQRSFRRAPGLVTDGRDMASVVFPDAVCKIFLTASAEARADRRYKQLKEKGMGANIAALLQDIRTRDERDSQRSAAPLQQAPGASLLDTTALNIEQAVQEVLDRYQAK